MKTFTAVVLAAIAAVAIAAPVAQQDPAAPVTADPIPVNTLWQQCTGAAESVRNNCLASSSGLSSTCQTTYNNAVAACNSAHPSSLSK
ncbi:hypothetical protein BC939DRAFT_507813 [Gamsiella multidivaricata]|uniref:uncharacterized protein n=1 Tax=Gamsiella multidivaricata TaxID=101098 RepID=UPI00221ECC64|nr:uncharacterized protein BC939DRAFT_507813 [Gamsiella multidivaricata]KAG0365160.1 hypothetical protein BGZ54_006819 [Gamsiella multidivaricata]KAI7816953.1 hypothetical protein BC939DRAFT_507813 [Gamsiella multidivaricata]